MLKRFLRINPNTHENDLDLYKSIQNIKSESKLIRQEESVLQANRVAHMNIQLQNSTKSILDNEKKAHEIRKSQVDSTIQFHTNTPWYQRALDLVYAVVILNLALLLVLERF